MRMMRLLTALAIVAISFLIQPLLTSFVVPGVAAPLALLAAATVSILAFELGAMLLALASFQVSRTPAQYLTSFLLAAVLYSVALVLGPVGVALACLAFAVLSMMEIGRGTTSDRRPGIRAMLRKFTDNRVMSAFAERFYARSRAEYAGI